MKTRIVLDTCVVISAFDERRFAARLRASLKGKQVGLVLCDTVLREIHRIRGMSSARVVRGLSKLVGKSVEVFSADGQDMKLARSVTDRYRFCHNGDNLILALCQARDFVLVTFDRMLLRACEIVGVMAFHPQLAGGI